MTIAGTIRRELPNALFCLVCVWLIVAGLPYWFGQAFAYSGTLDRTEAAAKAAEATFGCHAHIAAVSMTLIGIVSMCARAIHLKKASGGRAVASWGRALVEHAAAAVGSWAIFVAAGGNMGVRESAAVSRQVFLSVVGRVRHLFAFERLCWRTAAQCHSAARVQLENVSI